MANWPPEVAWHERDVVVPLFQLSLEAHGWETETETAFVDLVAHRGNETIYAEAKGRTKSRPGAGLDTLYGQLLRRMPAEEVDDPNTRFAVVIPSGLKLPPSGSRDESGSVFGSTSTRLATMARLRS